MGPIHGSRGGNRHYAELGFARLKPDLSQILRPKFGLQPIIGLFFGLKLDLLKA